MAGPVLQPGPGGDWEGGALEGGGDKARPSRVSSLAPHTLTCREVGPGSRLADEYIRHASLIPKTFTFSLSQNLTPPSQKYLASPSSPGDRLQASEEGPEVRPGTEDLVHRPPVGSGSAGDGAVSRARQGGTTGLTAERRRRGRPAHASIGLPARVVARRRSRHHRAPAEHVCAGAGRLRPPDPHPASPGWMLLPGPPQRGRRVSEGLRSLAPSPRLPHPWKVPEMTFQPDN